MEKKDAKEDIAGGGTRETKIGKRNPL